MLKILSGALLALAVTAPFAQPAWVSRSSGTTDNLLSVAAGSGYIYAGGTSVIRISSSSGASWAASTPALSAALYGMSYSKSTVFAVGTHGASLQWYNGSMWTQVATGLADTDTLRALAWNGSRFYVVGGGSSGVISTALTPSTWTAHAGVENPLYGIACNTAASLPIAVGANGAIYEGANWTQVTSGVTSTLYSIVWTGSLWVAVGAEGTILTSSSSQGISGWTQRTSGTSARLRHVAWTGTALVAVGDSGTVLTSADGVNWIKSSAGTATLNDVFWTGNRLVAVGTGGTILTADSIAIPPPSAPTLFYPRDGTQSVSTGGNATYNWYQVSATVTYQIQVATDSLFTTGIIVSDSGIAKGAGTYGSYPMNALPADSRYYWRVRARTTTSVSPWSATAAFTTIPNAPSLLSPASDATQVSLNPTLIWEAVPGAQSYRVQISGLDTTLTATQLVVGPLKDDTKFTWSVNVTTLVGGTSPSASSAFTTTQVIPDAPTLTSPANNATDIALYAKVGWGTNSRARGWRLQVADNSAFTNPVIDDSSFGFSDHNRALTGVTSSTLYYWRVNARNTAGTSAWSAVRSFTTVPPVPATAPVLLYPATGATGIVRATQATWDSIPGATSYRFEVSASSGFSSNLTSDSAATLARAVGLVVANTLYYWRVRAINPGGTGPYSAVRTFTTGAVITAPVAPLLVSPTSKAVDVPLTPTLKWKEASSATSYRVHLSNDSAFATLISDATLLDTVFTPPALVPNTVYYWRVNGKNVDGTGAFSDVRKFTTVPASGLSARSVSAETIELTDSRILRLFVPASSRVSAFILDARGRKMLQVTEGELKAGFHTFPIPHSSQFRFLEIRSEAFHEVLKLHP